MIAKRNEDGSWKIEDTEVSKYGIFTTCSYDLLERMLRDAGYLDGQYELESISIGKRSLDLKLRDRTESK